MTNRFEVEARVPYLYRSDTAVGREYLEGGSFDSAVFNGSGSGIGDVEVTARYQLNEGGLDKPYYVGSLRFKSRTGRDPYEGTFSRSLPGFRGEAVQTELPTGSGFYGLQGAFTVLYPSDPVVLFGSLNYLYSSPRDNVTLSFEDGTRQNLGRLPPADHRLQFGIGLGLNEKMSLSSATTKTRWSDQDHGLTRRMRFACSSGPCWSGVVFARPLPATSIPLGVG